MYRVNIGHLGVTVGHSRSVGHCRVTSGNHSLILVNLLVTLGLVKDGHCRSVRVTLSFAFLQVNLRKT